MVVEFQNPEINPRRESENLWVPMSCDSALSGCAPFAAAFFREFAAEFPSVFSSLRFMAWPNLDDLYAFHDAGDSPLGIQIDYSLEYIVVWSLRDNGEYGDWGEGTNAQVQSAMNHVRSVLSAA